MGQDIATDIATDIARDVAVDIAHPWEIHWKTIEDLSPHIMLRADRGVQLATGVQYWTSQDANRWVFQHLVGAEQLYYNATGSCPSGHPSISADTAGDLRTIACGGSGIGAPFVSDEEWTVYALGRTLGAPGSLGTIWGVGASSTELARVTQLATTANRRFQVIGTGVNTFDTAAPTIDADAWERYSAEAAGNYETETAAATATDTVTTRHAGYDIVRLFEKSGNDITSGSGQAAEYEMYGFVAFARLLSAGDQAIAEAACDAIMGV